MGVVHAPTSLSHLPDSRVAPNLASVTAVGGTFVGLESELHASGDAVRVGVIGYGYWGPNLVRNFAEASGARVVAVSDLRPDRLATVRDRHPAVRLTTDLRDLLADPSVDAVAIATPVSTHHSLAMAALQAGKHVLVEKPLALTSAQAEELIEAADRLGLVLMVDHTFVYTGAVQKIKELVDSGGLGRLYYYDSVRANLGLFQQDVSVLWDLAVHDLAIMDHLLGTPSMVSAVGAAHIPGRPMNTAYLTCVFEDDLIAHCHVNWLAPVKIRRSLIGGALQMIVYDDLEASEKVKVYDKGVTVAGGHNGNGVNGSNGAHGSNGSNGGDSQLELLVGYRAGDMHAPRLSVTEALRVEAQHFVDCIRTSTPPLTDGESGLRVIRVLEAAERSLANGGVLTELR
jgi:predicted dehydrogenase